MTAYEVIQQHPEWVKNPTATRKAIEAAARRYVRELNNNALIVEDLDALLIARNALLNPTKEAKDFAQIAIVGNEIVDDGAKRMAKVYALFIKGIIAELNGKAICTAAQIQEWRERYGVKLEGLQGKPDKADTFEPLGFDEETAVNVYNQLVERKKIYTEECSLQDFIWYFGKKENREFEAKPNPIKWHGTERELAVLCMAINYVLKNTILRPSWKTYHCITGGKYLGENQNDRLKDTANDIRNGGFMLSIDTNYLAAKLLPGYECIRQENSSRYVEKYDRERNK